MVRDLLLQGFLEIQNVLIVCDDRNSTTVSKYFVPYNRLKQWAQMEPWEILLFENRCENLVDINMSVYGTQLMFRTLIKIFVDLAMSLI